MQVQVCHHAVFFEHRDEEYRGDVGAVLPAPAGQGFRADDPPVGHAALGLQVEGDIPVFQRVLEFSQQLEFLHVPLMHFRIVYADMVLQVVLDFLRGQRRLVEQVQGGIAVFRVDDGDAEDREESADPAQRINRAAEIGKQPVNPVAVIGEEEGEVVLPAVAGNAARFLRGFVQRFREADQQLLAVLLPVQLLEKLEMLDIHGDQAPAAFRRVAQPLLHIGEKNGFRHLVRHLVQQVLGGERRVRVLAFLAVPDFLHVIHVEVNDIVRQAEFRPGDQQDFHLAPFPVERQKAEPLCQDAHGIAPVQPLFHVGGVREGLLPFNVLRMKQVGGSVIHQSLIDAAVDGHEKFSVRVVAEFVLTGFQVDDQQLVKGRVGQGGNDQFRLYGCEQSIQEIKRH